MDNLLWIVLEILLCSTAIVFLYSYSSWFSWRSSRMMTSSSSSSSSSYETPLPLGNLGWPFIGETIDFVSCAYSDRPESFMDKRRRMYGKVFKSHIFGSPTIVSTDAEVSRFILQSDAKVFVPSYPKSLTELMGKSSILLINGSLQRRIHGLIGAFFKSHHLKAQITRDMQSYIAFQVLVKALISLDPGEEMELLKKQFQEFIAGEEENGEAGAETHRI
uniref:Uncharacterized protein n=1 Tax=Salix viminalis TaxID=40686 RepID=A0A6N2MB33_SALVM